jgi:hypothetical protein
VFALNMEVIRSSETSVNTISTRRHIPEDCFLHENEHVRGIGQGEAIHRKYKRFKLGGGQAYDRSSE